MNHRKDVFSKKAFFLLENERYAFLCIGVLVWLPLMLWCAVALMGLITLRLSYFKGLKACVIGSFSLYLTSMATLPLCLGLEKALFAFVPSFFIACALRRTKSWHFLAFFIVMIALLGLTSVYWFAPDLGLNQYHALQALFKSTGDNPVTELFNSLSLLNERVIASYFIGIQTVSLIFSAIVPIMIARSTQAKLFYPGGYLQEMLTFRASRKGCLIFLLIGIGAYQQNELAISCLPVLVLYYAAAGISLNVQFFKRNRWSNVYSPVFFLTLFFLPFVMLPVCAFLGVADSLFNFRLHLPAINAGK